MNTWRADKAANYPFFGVFMAHRHEALPHTWRDEKRAYLS